MKWSEIKLKPKADLQQLILGWTEELEKARVLKGYQKQTEKPHLFRLHRRNIARAKMMLKEMEKDGTAE